ncbi:hypothetical protein J0910_14235 [Nocardiopsis sp. CNT-189]|uniref:hypothetical protein n=1 Tax=Nocardiopsis oceanisediminis TaxID=2816862 RepID=UPI003B332153
MTDPSPTAVALTTPSLLDPAETLAANFPEWHVFRDLLDGPGHWRAVREDRAVSAPSIAELRERLARVELAEADR